jgi:hypothetical protein
MRLFVIAAVVLVLLAAAAGALFYFAPTVFFEMIDPKGPTVRQAIGSLLATAATAAFTKYIVQYEARATQEKAEQAADAELHDHAASIVRAYADVHDQYSEMLTTIVDRVARLARRKQEVTKGIERSNWETLVWFAASPGINAHLLFLSRMISPNRV